MGGLIYAERQEKRRFRLATATNNSIGNPEKPNARFSTELKGHTASIQKVAFNPVKDAELCSVSDDGVVKFWDVRTKACVNEVKGLGDAFTLVWAPDGESLIVGNKVSSARHWLAKREVGRLNDP